MTETSIRIPASSRPSGKATFVMLGNGFDEIEALAPVDVMRRAGMEVFTVSMTDKRLVRGATGNNIVADMGISDLDSEQIDWLIFPGADKSEDAVNLDESLNDIVKDHWDKGGNIAAICAAPALILGPLGIIKGVNATGYPFLKEDLERNGGIYSDESVVIGDRMITSKGPGTTLEFALAIVRKAKGPETEKALREGMVIPECG
ncbi:DJ-1 family glyoxalase III [Muribaculum intestinale]|uniref:DJ-1 family glyoxalase III n=1 Tax=Muribaculum intestinale TaxID=1796646 RepID=UPI00259CF088|nr:DJ-1 family glyoxalase III [Muribaculum intestinale]